jgi:hypothetical protein
MAAAERSGVVGREEVDADGAGVHPVRDGEGRLGVLPEHQPAESELGVIGQRHGLVDVVVLQDAASRSWRPVFWASSQSRIPSW